MVHKIPVVILSGFLGSGKTTLLNRMLDYYATRRLRPAIIVNEVGDVNLDGLLLDNQFPMREMLSGCICCTIRGDLETEIRNLIEDASPDLILIEATGVANPLDIFESVTEAALIEPIDVQAMITVTEAAHTLRWLRKGIGKTYHLIADQIRCASMLLLNKIDLISVSERDEVNRLIGELNSTIPVHQTVQCEVSEEMLNRVLQADEPISFDHGHRDEHDRHSEQHPHDHDHHSHDHRHQHDRHTERHPHDHDSDHRHEHDHHDHHHDHADHHEHPHSYDHVMVYTHYFEQPLESGRFEQIMSGLPENVYRAKGIFTKADTGERMMFQYAYRQLDMFRINPQGKVQDVAVFMGEQFPKVELKRKLELELRDDHSSSITSQAQEC